MCMCVRDIRLLDAVYGVVEIYRCLYSKQCMNEQTNKLTN